MPYVKNTVVVSSGTLPGADGTTLKELVIAWEGAAFEPGQFLMVAPVCGESANWPSPLMIQRGTGEGVVVLVHPDSPLYALRAGDALTAFGPNGKGVPVKGSFAVLCDARGLPLVAPLLRAKKDACQGLYLVDGCCGADAAEPVCGVAAKPVDALEKAVDFGGAQTLVVALPLDKLARWKKAAPALAEKSVVFVGAKVGCGMGACRGCYIHSGPDSTGVAVCQEGPFMPMDAVDYAKDQNFLGHYI